MHLYMYLHCRMFTRFMYPGVSLICEWWCPGTGRQFAVHCDACTHAHTHIHVYTVWQVVLCNPRVTYNYLCCSVDGAFFRIQMYKLSILFVLLTSFILYSMLVSKHSLQWCWTIGWEKYWNPACPCLGGERSSSASGWNVPPVRRPLLCPRPPEGAETCTLSICVGTELFCKLPAPRPPDSLKCSVLYRIFFHGGEIILQ